MRTKPYYLAFCSAVILCVAVLGGCVQMPTETASIPDMRPQISFHLANPAFTSARVFVDGMEMGAAGDYLDGSASLRVLPGTHSVKVMSAGSTILDERVYMGDGVRRTLVVSGGIQ